MGLLEEIVASAIRANPFNPKMGTSTNFKHWISVEDLRRCIECARNHGKIWLISETPYPEPPIHPGCRCMIELMRTIAAGTATVDGTAGADWTVKYGGNLPDYYITKENAEKNGWKRGKWLSDFAPDKMITAGIYKNNDGHLPEVEGRVWYEADINYKTGRRNSQRLLWSNDGLLFVTYDHYETFYEIV